MLQYYSALFQLYFFPSSSFSTFKKVTFILAQKKSLSSLFNCFQQCSDNYLNNWHPAVIFKTFLQRKISISNTTWLDSSCVSSTSTQAEKPFISFWFPLENQTNFKGKLATISLYESQHTVTDGAGTITTHFMQRPGYHFNRVKRYKEFPCLQRHIWYEFPSTGCTQTGCILPSLGPWDVLCGFSASPPVKICPTLFSQECHVVHLILS